MRDKDARLMSSTGHATKKVYWPPVNIELESDGDELPQMLWKPAMSAKKKVVSMASLTRK
jgi:hypothetical protein